MNNPKYYFGNYIKIYQISEFYDNVRVMLLEHFDRPSMIDTLFLLGSICETSCKEFKKSHPDYRVIVYQLEQLMDGLNWNKIETLINNLDGADEIWDYDPLNAEYLKLFHNIKVDRVIPMLYCKNLDLITNKKNPSIDVLFYGYMNERRAKIFKHIQYNCFLHFKIMWIFGTVDLDKYIEDSKIILNLHAFEPYNRQEQVRMFYPLINGKTIVSEKSQHNNMPGCILEDNYENFPLLLKETLYSGRWRDFGEQAKQIFIKHTNDYLKNNNLI